MNSTLQVLTYARALVNDPLAWMRGDYSHDAAGNAVEPTDNAAVCFCIVGACQRAEQNSVRGGYIGAQNHLFRALEISGRAHVSLPHFNDDLDTTHADVLFLFDAAIELASK